jgi:hypothetical protein
VNLTSVGGRSALAFLSPTGEKQLVVGMDWKEKREFVYLYESGGSRVTAALVSNPPHSAGTLSLGDKFWSGRFVLGALPSDIVGPPDNRDNEEWGLELRNGKEKRALVSILVDCFSHNVTN